MQTIYWPHHANFERLARSSIDWRLLCPGPSGSNRRLGLERLRISLDRLPVDVPAFARALPKPLVLPVLASLIPQLIVPYADTAALMCANLDSSSEMARHRFGLAPPAGIVNISVAAEAWDDVRWIYAALMSVPIDVVPAHESAH